MQALQMSARIVGGVCARAVASPVVKPLAMPRTFAPALTRGLTEEQRKKRDAYRDKMQYPDDTPVYLKGGTSDYALFGLSVMMVGGGTLYTFYRVYVRYYE